MNEQIHVEDFEIVSDMIDAAARKLWRKSYKTCLYVFGSFEDVTQVGWAAMCGRKSSRELIAESIGDRKGLVQTIAYRGMIDYVRSVLGRRDAENCARKLKLFMTTHYMDYYLKSNPDGQIINHDDMLDYIMPTVESETPESLTMAAALQSEIDEFFNRKLNRKDKMIMDYIFKQGLGQKEIGNKFGITESRVSQIRTKAIKHARKRFTSLQDIEL